MTEKMSLEILSGDAPLAQLSRIWSKMDLIDRRLFLNLGLKNPLKLALAESKGDIDVALEIVALRG